MKPYPATIGSCNGDCQQDPRNCKTQALCQITLPPIITKMGGLSVHRGIPSMPIEYAEPEPVHWGWKAIGAVGAVTALVYLALGSHLIYLAWPL